jgi:hypothetical protein
LPGRDAFRAAAGPALGLRTHPTSLRSKSLDFGSYSMPEDAVAAVADLGAEALEAVVANGAEGVMAIFRMSHRRRCKRTFPGPISSSIRLLSRHDLRLMGRLTLAKDEMTPSHLVVN